MRMWKYYRKAPPSPADEVPRRTRIASLTCGITISLLLAVAALIAPRGTRIETRAVLLAFAAFFVVEFPSLVRLIVAKRDSKGRIPIIAFPAAVFCALTIFLTICILLLRQPSPPLTEPLILLFAVANIALAIALTAANRITQADLQRRQILAATKNRLTEAAEKAAKSTRASEDSPPKST